MTALPTVTLGEDNGCQLTYNGQTAIDRFPYGVFSRLVAPQLSIVQAFHWTRFNDVRIPLPLYQGQVGGVSGQSSYADRVPVEQPLAVDGFRDQIMGLGAGGTFVSDETVPMAATLGSELRPENCRSAGPSRAWPWGIWSTRCRSRRATFSTWANETGAARPDVIEACLAHREADLVRKAHNRAQFSDERRALLRDWANFLGRPWTSNVVPIRSESN